MDRRILTLLLNVAFFIALIYGCYVFQAEDTPNLSTFTNFVPAGIIFIMNILQAIVWTVIGDKNNIITQMDPVTVIFIVVAGSLMLLAAYTDEDGRSNKIFNWAFALMTFVVGFETGKLRHKSKRA